MNPPPPPPHGEAPKSSGLPPGKYDIFIIPPHSSGSGFLYLPSLQPNVNSFAAGFATALILVAIGSMLAPAFQAWWHSAKATGGMGMFMLMVAIGVGAWALGRTQSDGGPGPGGGASGSGAAPPPQAGPQPGPQSNPQPNGYASGSGPTPNSGHAGSEQPKSSWQRAAPPPGTTNAGSNTANGAAKGAWEKAREETKKRAEEQKAREAEKKRKEDLEKRLKEAREKEAREREIRERLAREKETREKQAREKEAREKEANKPNQEDGKPKGSTYAFSAVGERTNPWPRGQKPSPRSQPTSPTKKPPPPPTARTYLGTEEETYSFRPYDKPKTPMHKKSHSSLYSESSYAASQSTSRTTPPPSHRGPYSTKDPDKIVIKAVYSFNNAFLKTPTSQLVSGVGSVTDGLILRITTEGLFIDDDVRGVPQREWDVKAWTMKLVEVWCPSFRQGSTGTASASARVASSGSPLKRNHIRRLWGLDKEKSATPEEVDALLIDMLQLCKENCRLRSATAPATNSSSSAYSSAYSSAASSNSFDTRSSVSDSAYGSSISSSSTSSSSSKDKKTNHNHQTGELKTARLHILRASIRDQEGKKYVFVISEDESWKVSVGLQRLRKGTQVRALGVSGMSANDARSTLENLGWG